MKNFLLKIIPKKGTIVPIMGTNDKIGSSLNLKEPIASALFGKTRRAILSLFFTQSDREFYVREIIRNVGSGRGAVERELRNLHDAGIISKTSRGRQIHYKANDRCPVYDEIKSLIVKICGISDILKTALEPFEDKIKLAFIYGSVANNTEDYLSDIDLMIVGKVDMSEIFGALTSVNEKLRRITNPHVISQTEFRKRLIDNHDFISRIWKEKKIVLIGDENEFTRLV